MDTPPPQLTAHSTIDAWLTHPKGAPLIKGLLDQAGVPQEMLAPVRTLPLRQLVAVSQGQLPQAVVDDLVLQVNDGVVPAEESAPGVWTERVTPGRFDGKTVIVTGAASGIGRATASRVTREGGRVIAVDVSAERLETFAASLPDGAIATVLGDITLQGDIDRIVVAADGRIDALANVAGVNDDFSPVHETSDEIWDRVIGINLTGGFKLSRAVLPLMMAAGAGSIVNVASEAALRGNSSGTAYTVSKHGVLGLTRSAAFMYGPHGIRVNAVAPGGVATGIPMPAHVSPTGSARLAPFQQAIPSLATAEQLAASITFLLSDDGININGAVLPSDGGWSVQ
ncbi:SDR family oxidoreductase [Streptomyces sp. NL15-2K]|uniref:SDR family oxidoreductase n=1 Tax=Streptomyces sp. NL15-2K TaxID=376149 RepID=UPI000F55A13C|nr:MULTISPECIES: SDR family oxidoreductase [Actinomycetes]WKX15821.1 SDR family oxidoreductase [Kutzneria buriramensis]GCB42786.1 short-chain dehydrogenase/reductase family oxidoreductase [Streptomyces sp. NL15-2K]